MNISNICEITPAEKHKTFLGKKNPPSWNNVFSFHKFLREIFSFYVKVKE